MEDRMSVPVEIKLVLSGNAISKKCQPCGLGLS